MVLAALLQALTQREEIRWIENKQQFLSKQDKTVLVVMCLY